MYPSNKDKKSYTGVEQTLVSSTPIAPSCWLSTETNSNTFLCPQRRRQFYDRVGTYNTCVVIGSTALILAAIGLLTFIWVGALKYIKGAELPMIWSKILERHWIPRTVTISSVGIRMGVAAQLGVSTAMLAALLLESVGVEPKELALLSIIRCINTGPISLASCVLRSFHSFRNPSQLVYSTIIIIALLNAVVLQFTFTILISDFEFGAAKSTTSNIAFRISEKNSSSARTSRGIDYWKSGPSSYPYFAEYSEPPYETDGYIDTGKTYRAYLPFSSQVDRRRLRKYTVAVSIADARAICVQPAITYFNSSINRGLYIMDELVDSITISGGLAWHIDYPSLKNANRSGGESPEFNCSVPLPSQKSTSIFQWVALCQVYFSPADITGGPTSNADESASGITQAWLLLNATADREAWSHLFNDYNASNIEWQLTSSGVWTTTRHQNVGFDITLCFTNPALSYYHVEISKTADHEEPILAWNPTKSLYDTHEIRRMLGATAEHLSLKDRRVFALQQPTHWKSVARDSTQDEENINYVSLSWLYGFGGFNGVGSDNGDGSQSVAVFTSEGEPSYPNSVHRSHTAIALDILNDTKNPALSFQALMTIIMQMSYYDFLPEFDVSLPANYTISSDVEIPVHWKGFKGVTILLLLHLSLVLVSIVLFLTRTELSLLGNAWQAVAQTVSTDTATVVKHASELTDRDVGEFIRRTGIAEGRFIIKRLYSNRRSEGVLIC